MSHQIEKYPIFYISLNKTILLLKHMQNNDYCFEVDRFDFVQETDESLHSNQSKIKFCKVLKPIQV